jgi:hypothetical protein
MQSRIILFLIFTFSYLILKFKKWRWISQLCQLLWKRVAVWDKFGIAGQQLPPIHAPCLGYVDFSLADHGLIPKCCHTNRVANLGDFPQKMLRFFRYTGESGDFLGEF